MKGARLFGCLAGFVALLGSGAEKVRGQESLADLDSFRRGCRALADERFGPAAEQFRSTWRRLEGGDSRSLEREFVTERLLEALVRGGDAAAATQWIGQHPPVDPSPTTLRWTALALQRERRFAEAASHWDRLATTGEMDRSLLLDRATCLALANRAEAAFEILSGELEPETPAEALRFARIAERAGEFGAALDSLDAPAAAGEGRTRPRFAMARLRCWILRRLDRRSDALSVALDLIDRSESPRDAHRAFLLLEELGGGAFTPGLTDHFERWRESGDHPAAAAAAFFGPLWSGDAGERLAHLESVASAQPPGPFAAEARLRLQRLERDPAPPDRAPGESIELPGGPERIDFERAAAAYRAEVYERASRRFLELAEEQAGENRLRGLRNAAVAALRNDDFASFSSIRDRLDRAAPTSSHPAELDSLAGLFLASRGDPEALSLLQDFVRDHPDHESTVEARLALAEIHLNQVPARPQAAKKILAELRARPLTLGQSERLDYTAVWAERIDDAASAFVERAEEFLRDWPNSEYFPEIAMLLGKRQFRDGNSKAARRAFIRVTSRFPDSRFAETARFFSIRATPPGEQAIAEWRQLVDEGGPTSTRARHELALLLLTMERFEQARNELKRVAESAPDEAPIRFAAMADLAFAHYLEALTRDRDPESLGRAADAFANLSNLRQAPVGWRYQAAVRRGKCLEALGNPTVALEIYRSIVTETFHRSSMPPPGSSIREADWLFRAGFAAIRILRDRSDWSAAIKMADTLSRKEGPRSIEAARLAERLRLEHWVWE